MIQKPLPWWGGLIAFGLVFMAIGCIPITAIGRKLHILNWNYAKQAQSETGGYTQSTAKFIRSVSSVDEIDSGQIDDVNPKPYTDTPESKNSRYDGVVSFT